MDNILERLDEDYPDLSFQAKLSWAGMAKNSLQMVYGYSPNQLVFGKNPNLPDILSGSPPSFEETTSSEALAKHLNLLHASRKAFIKSEACTKIKAALRAKIRTSEEVYENGDIVYYRRAKDGKWMGPSKVVFQDGKIIFLRNGGILVRVSANRLVKAGTELSRVAKERMESDPDKEVSERHIGAQANKISEDLLGSQNMDSFGAQTNENPVEEQNNRENNALTSKGKISLKNKDRIRLKEGDHWIESTITGRCKVTGKYRNHFNILRDDGIAQNVNLEEVEFEKVNASPNKTRRHQSV